MKKTDYTKIIEEAKHILQEVLPIGRFEHTLRVGDLTRELAANYGENEHKAYLAGITHDIAKKREKELLKKYDIRSIIPEEDWDTYFPILHSPLGYFEARESLGIEDEDILNAIMYHTTGRPNMTVLDKIVYVADATEPGREGNIIKDIRQMAFRDLDKSVVMTMNMGIRHCIDDNKVMHPLTVEARNYYLQKGVDFE